MADLKVGGASGEGKATKAEDVATLGSVTGFLSAKRGVTKVTGALTPK